jgi:hypothetical protein
MDHDRIAGAAGGGRERVAVNAEAERVARRAADALRASREERQRIDVSVPTWCACVRWPSSAQRARPR